MDTIFIVTEANEKVATGHLMECIACAEELAEMDYKVSFWINDDTEAVLKERIPCHFRQYHRSIEEDYDGLVAEIMSVCPKAVLFNLRKISENFLKQFKEDILGCSEIICIDEFGHRKLDADIIINPMIDPCYWNYGESQARLFLGPEYLILNRELEDYHSRRKLINDKIRKIFITMGGVDPRNYTADMIGIVVENFPGAVIDVVIGGGYQHYEKISYWDHEKSKTNNCKIKISRNISGSEFLKLMYNADLTVCAGGNTLHEAACAGTPAIILPSMPHEEKTALFFQQKGFGLVIDVHSDWKKEVSGVFDKIRTWKIRSEMSAAGKVISDGAGRRRIVDIIQNWGKK